MAEVTVVEARYDWQAEIICPRCGHKEKEIWHTDNRYIGVEKKEFTCHKCQLIFREEIYYNASPKKAKK